MRTALETLWEISPIQLATVQCDRSAPIYNRPYHPDCADHGVAFDFYRHRFDFFCVSIGTWHCQWHKSHLMIFHHIYAINCWWHTHYFYFSLNTPVTWTHFAKSFFSPFVCPSRCHHPIQYRFWNFSMIQALRLPTIHSGVDSCPTQPNHRQFLTLKSYFEMIVWTALRISHTQNKRTVWILISNYGNISFELFYTNTRIELLKWIRFCLVFVFFFTFFLCWKTLLH